MSNKLWKKVLTPVLATGLAISMLSVPFSVSAKTVINGTHEDGSAYTVEKVSNPNTGEGEVDGLNESGDRASSYCWAMAENDGYVYIGTWANGLYQEIMAVQNGSLDIDTVNNMVSLVSNGEVDACEEDSYKTAKIYRYNESTGDMDLLFNPADYKDNANYYPIYGFRAAITFKGQVYMDGLYNISGNNCKLLRVNSEDNFATPEIVLESGSLRAMCVSVDGETMYVGGSTTNVADGYKSNCALYKTTTGNKGDYEAILDYKDLDYYAKNGKSLTLNDCLAIPSDEYGEELIASVITSYGVVVYRGHVATADEADKANEAGYVWTELAGVQSDSYPASLGNYNNVTLTPVYYDGDLYLMSMIDDMSCQLYFYMGVFYQNTTMLYNGIDKAAKTLTNRCSIYKYDLDTGTMEMVMGDEDTCPKSITYAANIGSGWSDEDTGFVMYAWRGIEYNDRLYVNTIDASTMYRYMTNITNGQLLGLNYEDFSYELDVAFDLISQLMAQDEETPSDDAEAAEEADELATKVETPTLDAISKELAYQTLYKLYEMIDQQATTESVSQMMSLVNKVGENADTISAAIGEIGDLLEAAKTDDNADQIDQIVASLDSLETMFANFDSIAPHLQNYQLISDACANYDQMGGDLYCTDNGYDWECITDNGFNDKYNHGVRTFALSEDKSTLYLGMANPYYGAQLFTLEDENVNEKSITRYSGETRYETNQAIADALKAELGVDQFDTVLVASSTNYPDALSGSYLAQLKDAPILLVDTTSADSVASVTAYINKNLSDKGQVYILGGKTVISQDFETTLAKTYNVKRLAGDNRFGTNIAILKECNVTKGTLLVTSCMNYPDALSASAVNKPVLLVGEELTEDQIAYLKSLDLSCIEIIGGKTAVSTDLEAALANYGDKVTRISGETRFETSTAVASTFASADSDTIVLANAYNFPDALSGGPLAAKLNAPLVLVADDNYDAALAYATENGIDNAVILGGTSVLQDQTAKTIISMK